MNARVRSRPAAAPTSAGSHSVQRMRTNKRVKGSAINLFSKDEAELDAHTIEMKRYVSTQITDPFVDAYSGGGPNSLLQPRYSPYSLLKLPTENSTLLQCINAYVVNIEGHGHRLEYVGPEGADDSPEAIAEFNRLTSLLDQPNYEYSLTELRQRVRRDYETLGYSFIEAGRDNTNEVTMLYHLAGHTVRMTGKDKDPTEITRWFWRNGKRISQKLRVHFRRYVQQVGATRVFFKEFGDPRVIDPKTGLVNNALAKEEAATEVIHMSRYTPGDAYGLPLWVNQIPNILGQRESEMVNLQFFKDNAVPAMAVLVSGGTLSEEAVEDIDSQFNRTRGRASMNRILVLEATGIEENASEDGVVPAPRLDIKPLADSRQKDATFQDYDEACGKKIRSSFRLPPLFLGNTEDMTHATASASLQVTESQVFGPERGKIDELFNLHILAKDGAQPLYWRMRSLPPRITNPEEVTNAIEQISAAGGMTPNVAIGMGNELFDLNIPMITAPWGNYPIEFSTTLLEAGNLSGIDELYRNEPEDQTGEPGVNDPPLDDFDTEDNPDDDTTKQAVDDAPQPTGRQVRIRNRERTYPRQTPVIKMRRLI